MFYPDEIVDEVRNRSDIVDIISGYITLKKAGNTYKGLCPFHNEKTPSFHVNGSGQFFHCFGCGKGGNVYTFIMEYENYSFPEAIQYLAEKAGVNLPEVEFTEAEKKHQSLRMKLFEINKEAARFYFHQLRNKPGEIGLKYFTDRGLSKETMQKFGLGFALPYTDALYKYLKSLNYSDEILRESGLFTFNEKYGFRDKFINRVMFPITDINKKVIAFGGRVMGEGEPKYLNSPETKIFSKSNNLYALDTAKTSRKDRIIMCEGYMDVIAMHQAGFTEAAASLGTAFTFGHAMLLKRYTKNIYLAYDSDKAGTNAALKNIGILREAGLNTRVINMEPYKDPDEFIKNLGAEEFSKRIDEAENGFMFEIRQLKKNYNTDDPGELTSFHNAIAEKLCIFEEDIERNNYLEAVCAKYYINIDSMKKMLFGKSAKRPLKEERSEDVTPLKTGKKEKDPEENIKKNQRYLLTYLVNNPALYNKIKGLVTVDDFTNELYKDVASQLFVQLEEGKTDASSIINPNDDIDKQRAVAEVFDTNIMGLESEEDEKKAFRDVVIAVKKDASDYFIKNVASDTNAIQKMVALKKDIEKLEKTLI